MARNPLLADCQFRFRRCAFVFSLSMICLWSIMHVLSSVKLLNRADPQQEKAKPCSKKPIWMGDKVLPPIGFAYTHNTGSDSLMNMLAGLQQTYDSSVMLPVDYHNLGWPGPFPGAAQTYVEGRKDAWTSQKYDMILHAAVFNAEQFRSYLKPNPFFVTIIRDPVKQIQSAFDKYLISNDWTWGLPGDDHNDWTVRIAFLESLAGDVKGAREADRARYWNPQVRDLGLYEKFGPTADQVDDASLQEWVVELGTSFHHIMIDTFFDQSLILLGKKLGLQIGDLTYYDPNEGTHHSTPSLAQEKRLRELLRVDTMVYTYWEKVFQSEWLKYGNEAELQELRSANRKLREACSTKSPDAISCPAWRRMGTKEFSQHLMMQAWGTVTPMEDGFFLLPLGVEQSIGMDYGADSDGRELCHLKEVTDANSGTLRRAPLCRNWGENLEWSPRGLLSPSTEEELAELVRYLSAKSLPFKVVGTGHSWSPIFLPDTGLMVKLGRMNKIVSLDRVGKTVTVQGGTLFKTIYEYLDTLGLAVDWMGGGIATLTVGGAISTGYHGSRHDFGTAASVVRRARIVAANGTVLDLRPGSEELRAVRTGLGLSGIISSVTFPITRQFYLTRWRYRVQGLDDFLANQLSQLKRKHGSVHWYWNPHTDDVWVMGWESASEEDFLRHGRPCRPGLEQWEDGMEKKYGPDGLPLILRWDNCTDISFKSYTHENDMSQKIWNTECIFSAEHDVAVTKEYAELIRSSSSKPHPAFWIHMRYSKEDDSFLSSCGGLKKCSNLEIALTAPTMDGPLPTREVWEEQTVTYNDMCLRNKGRPHWGKYTPAQVGEGYSYLKSTGLALDEFMAVARKMDPKGLFMSSELSRLLEPVGARKSLRAVPDDEIHQALKEYNGRAAGRKKASRRVYIDLGANCGNDFPPEPLFSPVPPTSNGELPVVRSPCGTPLAPNSSVEVHIFEGNPNFKKTLEQVRAGSPPGSVTLHFAAVGTKDGWTEFSVCEGHCEQSSKRMDANLRSGRPEGRPTLQKVREVDLARFLCDTVHPEDDVVVKMDVEGEEYNLLPHLVKHPCAAAAIDRIFIEIHWRNRLTTLSDAEVRAMMQAWRILETRFGVKFFEWQLRSDIDDFWKQLREVVV